MIVLILFLSAISTFISSRLPYLWTSFQIQKGSDTGRCISMSIMHAFTDRRLSGYSLEFCIWQCLVVILFSTKSQNCFTYLYSNSIFALIYTDLQIYTIIHFCMLQIQWSPSESINNLFIINLQGQTFPKPICHVCYEYHKIYLVQIESRTTNPEYFCSSL